MKNNLLLTFLIILFCACSKSEPEVTFQTQNTKTSVESDNELNNIIDEYKFHRSTILRKLEENEQFLEQNQAITNDATSELVAKAMFDRGQLLRELDKKQDAISAYKVVISQFNNTSNQNIKKFVAKAKVEVCEIASSYQVDISFIERNIACYMNVIQNYEREEMPEVRVSVAKAWVDIGASISIATKIVSGAINENNNAEPIVRYLKSKGYQDAIKVYDTVIENYSSDNLAETKSLVALAMVNKGMALFDSNERADALIILNDTNRLYGDAEDHQIRNQVNRAMLIKGEALRAMNRNAEALATYEKLINKLYTVKDENALTKSYFKIASLAKAELESGSECFKMSIFLSNIPHQRDCQK